MIRIVIGIMIAMNALFSSAQAMDQKIKLMGEVYNVNERAGAMGGNVEGRVTVTTDGRLSGAEYLSSIRRDYVGRVGEKVAKPAEVTDGKVVLAAPSWPPINPQYNKSRSSGAEYLPSGRQDYVGLIEEIAGETVVRPANSYDGNHHLQERANGEVLYVFNAGAVGSMLLGKNK